MVCEGLVPHDRITPQGQALERWNDRSASRGFDSLAAHVFCNST
ncbi:hypothetical protein FREDWARD_101 [Mycobacterium phage Fredward]|nr:hypothetical protein V424_gp009 [Mycobacterium phage Fredward]AGY37046.1 hypothetical protein FREDWARD_101 [Mycobacterium phage Fredward]